MSKLTTKQPCRCCGYPTITEPRSWEICPICFWEDDGFEDLTPEECCPCNGVSLVQARENFEKFGACIEEMKKYVRMPTQKEARRRVRDGGEERCLEDFANG